MDSRLDAVVTGMGIVAPGGSTREAFWHNVREGRSATGTTTLCDPAPFRSKIAGEAYLDQSHSGFVEDEEDTLDRAAQLLIRATSEAVSDSHGALEDVPSDRIGVFIGSAVGATMSMERIYRETSRDGELIEVQETTDRDLYQYFVPSSFVAEIAGRFGASGPGELISNGCTSGIDALAQAMEAIRRGDVDVAIAGATEAPIAPITYACFDSIMATSNLNDTPETASRPYDATRAGFVLAEGAAVVIVESRAHAERRQAKMYGAITGYGARANAFHMTGLKNDGTELAEAITASLDYAGIEPGQIDYVNAHGSGTTQNDIHETAAIKKSLGQHAYDVPVSSLKSMTGHSMGSIGAIEVAVCLLAIRDNFVPPTANLNKLDPLLDLDYVPNHGRSTVVDRVVSIASGFGGFQSALVIERA
ncbi:beta-ketoacyl-[acyl-carrier-protein] synthase family protein [Glutamicibacter endophyticus]|uniref:beta-ketoacyl-[acyl-carrier-protein] synthase family protein n=1 Tax=Glutamicibacter endophyticus TaxID=1522174 RepID=UPI003AF0909A